MDTLERRRLLRERAASQDRALVAVSLDIFNEFNVLPWNGVVRMLKNFQEPPYLREVVRDYLSPLPRRVNFLIAWSDRGFCVCLHPDHSYKHLAERLDGETGHERSS